jgi:hypothetical protein
MTQFHEGQEVLVLRYDNGADRRSWGTAKIIQIIPDGTEHWDARDGYEIEFSDGTRAVFDADHIRPLGGHDYVGWRDEKGRPCNGPMVIDPSTADRCGPLTKRQKWGSSKNARIESRPATLHPHQPSRAGTQGVRQ